MERSFKKYYLIDEHEYTRLSRPLAIKNELSWKRPIDVRAKNEDSRSMKEILADDSISDDLKSKSYNQSLTRFINTKTSIPQKQEAEPVDESPDSIKPPPKPKAQPKKKKKKKKIITRHSPTRLRPTIKKRKFDSTLWLEY
jgi:hypothetical protein